MLKKQLLTLGLAAVVGSVLFSATHAEAGYYVRPVIQIGGGAFIDGYEADGATTASENFTTDYQSTVSLNDGTVKSYLNIQGPNAFASVAGTFGDQLVFSPNAIGTTAAFNFDFDGIINSDAPLAAINLPQIGIQATMYVYEAGSGVTYTNYGNAAFDAYKVVGETMFISMNPTTALINEAINDALNGSFTIEGSTYDLFIGLSIFASTSINPINIEMNFLNTGTLGIQTEDGVTFTSASGVLLAGAAVTEVPEPATWGITIASLGLMGFMARRRRNLAA